MDHKGLLNVVMVDEVEMIEDLTDKRIKVLAEERGRMLQARNTSIWIDKPFFELEIIPSTYSDEALLGFNYTAEMVDTQSIDIQMQFEHPEYVSSSIPEDKMKLRIWGIFSRLSDGKEIYQDS